MRVKPASVQYILLRHARQGRAGDVSRVWRDVEVKERITRRLAGLKVPLAQRDDVAVQFERGRRVKEPAATLRGCVLTAGRAE